MFLLTFTKHQVNFSPSVTLRIRSHQCRVGYGIFRIPVVDKVPDHVRIDIVGVLKRKVGYILSRVGILRRVTAFVMPILTTADIGRGNCRQFIVPALKEKQQHNRNYYPGSSLKTPHQCCHPGRRRVEHAGGVILLSAGHLAAQPVVQVQHQGLLGRVQRFLDATGATVGGQGCQPVARDVGTLGAAQDRIAVVGLGVTTGCKGYQSEGCWREF